MSRSIKRMAAAAMMSAAAVVFGETRDPFTGKVTSVLEGDVLVVQTEAGPVTVRVFGVDCPDADQPFFDQARAFTQSVADGTEVVLEPKGTDIEDRLVCDVVLSDGRNLNRELVRAGLAWRYSGHTKDDLILTRLTSEAMEAGRGLWSQAAPLSPWDHRGERMNTEVFFPFSDVVPAEPPPSRARSIDLTAFEPDVRQKSVSYDEKGTPRLVLKGNMGLTDAGVAFIETSARQSREASIQRSEAQAARDHAYRASVDAGIKKGQELTEERQRNAQQGYIFQRRYISDPFFRYPYPYPYSYPFPYFFIERRHEPEAHKPHDGFPHDRKPHDKD